MLQSNRRFVEIVDDRGNPYFLYYSITIDES